MERMRKESVSLSLSRGLIETVMELHPEHNKSNAAELTLWTGICALHPELDPAKDAHHCYLRPLAFFRWKAGDIKSLPWREKEGGKGDEE